MRSALVQELNNAAVRDVLFRIGNLSPDFSVFRGINSQEDLDKMLKDSNCTPEAIEQMNRFVQDTIITRDVDELLWDSDKTQYVLPSVSCYV